LSDHRSSDAGLLSIRQFDQRLGPQREGGETEDVDEFIRTFLQESGMDAEW
jgi:hypothetical protein